MSWFRSGGGKSGFTFEGKVSKLLENLNFNIKWPDMEFPCLISSHLKNPHEIDFWMDFFKDRGQELPRYAKEEMMVSCKKSLREDDIVHVKKALLESIECVAETLSYAPAGLIITSSNIPDHSPKLGDNIFFWDFRRSFFYAWKSYYVNSSKRKFNSQEQGLPKNNSYVFMIDFPDRPTTNNGLCYIFFDQLVPLDARTLEDILEKIKNRIVMKRWIITGTVLLKIHTLNGYAEQILNKKKSIEKRVSTTNICFIINNIFDYSIASWEPLTFSEI